MRHPTINLLAVCLLFGGLAFSLSRPAALAQPNDQAVYVDALQDGWQDWYLDDIVLVSQSGTATPTALPETGPVLTIRAATDLHPISPYIYGINFPDEDLAAELNLPVARWGGNATTRYNWKNDISNRGSDWYFENIAAKNDNPAALPNGSDADEFVEQNIRTGAQTLLTIPMIGWTPNDNENACGFSQAKYGAQQKQDSWRPDCGNGILSNGTLISGNDPADTSEAIEPDFVTDWVAHLSERYNDAQNGGVRFYNLDNEPMLWNSTHRDVHPEPTSYDEIRDLTITYAAALKAADPNAATLGPVLWGWTAYFWSALDQAAGGNWWESPPDRLAHGNVPFVEWYLQQMQAYEDQHGQRILDYLDVHYYPQAENVSLKSAGGSETQALRLRSTRSLWDSTYSDESWIGVPVQLIPRLHAWVEQNYPGTKLAITEYNWGGMEHINGALALVDVLGIFGREGLDLATYWSSPQPDQPGTFAFRMYRNYDGAGGSFGETSISAASADQEKLAVYGALRAADSSLTLIVINKTATALTSSITLDGFQPNGLVQVYRYSPADLQTIVRQSNLMVNSSGFSATFPASSITMLVLNSTPIDWQMSYLPTIIK